MLMIYSGQFQMFSSSHFRSFVCAWGGHLSDLLFTCIWSYYTQAKRNRKRAKSNQPNSYSISIHMSFLLSQHLARLSFFYCCLFFRCDADISRWEAIIISILRDNGSRHVGLSCLYLLCIVIQYWFAIYSSWFSLCPFSFSLESRQHYIQTMSFFLFRRFIHLFNVSCTNISMLIKLYFSSIYVDERKTKN